jgi:hypothetical protein
MREVRVILINPPNPPLVKGGIGLPALAQRGGTGKGERIPLTPFIKGAIVRFNWGRRFLLSLSVCVLFFRVILAVFIRVEHSFLCGKPAKTKTDERIII